MISTTVHEFGHILHIGHCGNWSCLLNYGYEFGDFKEVNYIIFTLKFILFFKIKNKIQKGGCINLCP